METKLSPEQQAAVRDCIFTMANAASVALRDIERQLAAIADDMKTRLPTVEYDQQPDLVRIFARAWGEAYAQELPDMPYVTVVHALSTAVEHLGRLDLLDQALEILRESYFETQKKMRAPRQ